MRSAKTGKRVLVVALILALVATQSPVIYGQQESTSGPAQQEPTSAPAPESAEQIQALVAPIALYPDALVAQVLSGATFPDQIALAQNWLQEHQDLSGKKLMKEVNKQTWDPSVKALT